MTSETTIDLCPKCEKPTGLCICEAVQPIDNKISVIILRHPQEQDRILGTAHIATLQLQNSELKTGLSWANLTKVVGRPVDPKRWGVLYLGTVAASGVTAIADGYEPIRSKDQRVLMMVNTKGQPLPDQDEQLARLNGIIVLDGNWQQAKALWWRNAWMLKCRRLVLQPKQPSLYGELRREPRRESISTIEAAALALSELEGNAAIFKAILTPFRLLIEKVGKSGADTAEAAKTANAREPTQSRWTS